MVNFHEQKDFVPDRNEETLAELGTALFTVTQPEKPSDPVLERYANANGVRYHVLAIPAVGEGDEALWGGARQTRPGVRPVHTEVIGSKARGTHIHRLQTAAQEFLNQQLYAKLELARKWLMEWQIPLFHSMTISPPVGEDAVPVLTASASNRNRNVRLLAWHPIRPLLAIAHMSDRIYIYDMETQEFLSQTLHHAFQKDISALEWRPGQPTVLAVAVRHGTLLWKIPLPPVSPHVPDRRTRSPWYGPDAAGPKGSAHDPESRRAESAGGPKTKAGMKKIPAALAWASFLHCDEQTGVSALAWSPNGQLLATGCATNGKVIVWDCAFQTPTHLCGSGGYGTSLLRWSPNGRFLAVGSSGGAFSLHLYETTRWESKSLTAHGFIQTGCWTPDSMAFLFSVRDSCEVLAAVVDSPESSTRYRLSGTYALKRHERKSRNNEVYSVGGPIAEMVLDPNGERLVVSFAAKTDHDDDKSAGCTTKPKGNELIAVFIVRPSVFISDPKNPLIPSGFIRGPAWDQHHNPDEVGPKAVCLRFAQVFDRGSLLSVAWENGKVSFIPFYYISARHRQLQDQLRRAGW